MLFFARIIPAIGGAYIRGGWVRESRWHRRFSGRRLVVRVGLGCVLSILQWFVVQDAAAGRGELADKPWAAIGPLLPAAGSRHGRRRDHRQVINGILWQLRTGAPGGICRRAEGRGRPAMSSCGGGPPMGLDKILVTAQARDDGEPVQWIFRWTPRSCGRISTQLGRPVRRVLALPSALAPTIVTPAKPPGADCRSWHAGNIERAAAMPQRSRS
jgi:hypothetical protein